MRLGNLVITSEKIIAKSTRGKYNLKDEKVYIPEKIDFESKDKLTSGTMSKGTYDIKKRFLLEIILKERIRIQI